MRVVLYAEDMEPITVIELTEAAHHYLHKYGVVRLAVHLPMAFSAMNEAPIREDFRTVCIRAETFVRRDQRHMMLFTSDEESALLLKAAFLPGQQSAMRDKEAKAFANGFLHALSVL